MLVLGLVLIKICKKLIGLTLNFLGKTKQNPMVFSQFPLALVREIIRVRLKQTKDKRVEGEMQSWIRNAKY